MRLDKVEFEHVEAALKSYTFDVAIGERVASWVAEVLFANQGNPELQECLAGLLREQGWECSPPAVMAVA